MIDANFDVTKNLDTLRNGGMTALTEEIVAVLLKKQQFENIQQH